jgi:hypothetical protein
MHINYWLGDSLWKDLEAEFTRAATVRKELANAMYHRSDPDQLRKFKDLFLEYSFTHINVYRNYKLQQAF